MSSLCRLRNSLSLFVFSVSLFTYSIARADTYQTLLLGSDTLIPYGIDNFGDVVLQDNHCANFPCFQTYVSGELVQTTATPPNLSYDNGVECTVVGASTQGTSVHPVCNNGREVFSDPFIAGTSPLVTGTPSDLVEIQSNNGAFVLMNSLGDVVALDGAQDSVFEYIDLTTRLTPEPSTIALLGTGILGLVGLARRKFLATQ